MKHLESLILKMGYVRTGTGFKKQTENVTHWITIFGDDLQMFGYIDGGDTVYSTGIIDITSNQLMLLIEIFTTNHN